ncbi:MAG: succinate dehydrogenase, cytochrome b556 subunit [Pseudomonadota bacterium]|nr:succinate dehydrogenase, cytochrome b556 subunit [Pseudomonadota bacterium]
MVTSLKEQPLKKPPEYRNIHVTQLTSYRLPAAGWVSILHRISGAAMFLLLPFVIWMFDTSLTSEATFDQFRSVFTYGAAGVPGWFVKLVALGLIWAYLLHFCAGLRHLWMDATHTVDLRFGRISALSVIGLSTLLALALGAKLFSLY